MFVVIDPTDLIRRLGWRLSYSASLQYSPWDLGMIELKLRSRETPQRFHDDRPYTQFIDRCSVTSLGASGQHRESEIVSTLEV